MSDKLSHILQQASTIESSKSDDPDKRIIEALDKALKATTVTHAGCPWDHIEKEDKQKIKHILLEGSDE